MQPHLALSSVTADTAGERLSEAAATARYRDLLNWTLSLLHGKVKGSLPTSALHPGGHGGCFEPVRDSLRQYSVLKASKPCPVGEDTSILACSSPALLAYFHLAARDHEQHQQQQRRPSFSSNQPEDLGGLRAWVSAVQQEGEGSREQRSSRRAPGPLTDSDSLRLLAAFAALDNINAREQPHHKSSMQNSNRCASSSPATPTTPQADTGSHRSQQPLQCGRASGPLQPAEESGEECAPAAALPAFRALALLAEDQEQQQRRRQPRSSTSSSHSKPAAPGNLPSGPGTPSHSSGPQHQQCKPGSSTHWGQQEQQQEHKFVPGSPSCRAAAACTPAQAAAPALGHGSDELRAIHYLATIHQQQLHHQQQQEEKHRQWLQS